MCHPQCARHSNKLLDKLWNGAMWPIANTQERKVNRLNLRWSNSLNMCHWSSCNEHDEDLKGKDVYNKWTDRRRISSLKWINRTKWKSGTSKAQYFKRKMFIKGQIGWLDLTLLKNKWGKARINYFESKPEEIMWPPRKKKGFLKQ